MTDRKSFIINHMNKDHQRSLSLYLQVYCHVSSTSATKSPRLEDIRLTDMVITADNTRYTIPFTPPLTDLSETRARVVAMHKECLAALDLSDTIITEYRPPRGPAQILGFGACLAAFVGFSRRGNFVPGALVYEMGGLGRVPGLAEFGYRVQPVVFWGLVLAHVFEAGYLLAWRRLRRHGVGLFSRVWWAWVGSCVIEGFQAWMRFDGMVREREEKVA